MCLDLLNISVDVAKCGKYSQIHPVHLLFVSYKKWLVLPEQSIHGKVSTHKDVLLCEELTADVFCHWTSL